jgi:hypothetical protein
MKDTNKYKELFEHFENFWNIQKKQKQRGLNDFNLLTTVLKYSDEVRLHSRMIGSLLNPEAKHYQGTLFLELFLKVIGLDKWGLNLEHTKVFIEYEDIDLYITDGEKHIIIENKIWAEDQPCQIMKYINIIVEENKDSIDITNEAAGYPVLDKDTIQVLYLTPQTKDIPTAHKEDEDGYIFFKGRKDPDKELLECSKKSKVKKNIPNDLKNYKCKYKKITYKNDIENWLQKSQNEVRNITNLNESIQQYIDVVARVNKNYKGKVMNLKDFTKENKIELKVLFDMQEEIVTLLGGLLYDLFSMEIPRVTKVDKEIKKENKDITIYTENHCDLWFSKRSKDFGSFYKINDDYLLCIFVGKTNIHYGLVKHKNFKIHEATSEDEVHGLKYRGSGFGGLRWFSKSFPVKENLNILYDYNNSVLKQGIDESLEKILNRKR